MNSSSELQHSNAEVTSNRNAEENSEGANAANDGPECISCSCCCPFRHAHRNEETNEIRILCGNEARLNAGIPPEIQQN